MYEYDPVDQTPKLVNRKNIHAPKKAPDILLKIFFKKYFDIKPITMTLPHVKNVKLWYPINKSVIIKLTIKDGIYLVPNNAGI